MESKYPGYTMDEKEVKNLMCRSPLEITLHSIWTLTMELSETLKNEVDFDNQHLKEINDWLLSIKEKIPFAENLINTLNKINHI